MTTNKNEGVGLYALPQSFSPIRRRNMGKKKMMRAQERIACDAAAAKSSISNLKKGLSQMADEKGEQIKAYLLKKFHFTDEEKSMLEACIDAVKVDYELICNSAYSTIDFITLDWSNPEDAENRINMVLYNINSMHASLMFGDMGFYLVLLKNNLHECGSFGEIGDIIATFIENGRERA